MLKGSAFGAGDSHESSLAKLGRYMREAMNNTDQKMPLPNKTSAYYIYLPASGNHLIVLDEDALHAVNPDIFSYTLRDIGKDESDRNAVLSDLNFSSRHKGNEVAVAVITGEGELVVMEKSNANLDTRKAPTKLNNIKLNPINVSQMIVQTTEKYG
jgi:hypothetical protein